MAPKKKHKALKETVNNSKSNEKIKFDEDNEDQQQSKLSNADINSSSEVSRVNQQKNNFILLRRILGKCYIDVKTRFNLIYIPMCAAYPEICITKHSYNLPGTSNAEILEILSRAQEYYKQKLVMMFIREIQLNLLQSKFVGYKVLAELIKIIMGVEDNTVDKETIKEAVIILTNIFLKFPPCENYLYESYINLFNENFDISVNIDKIRISKYNDNLLFICLKLLEKEILITDEIDNMNIQSSINFTSAFLPRKICFDELNRTEKIDRLFIILKFILHILEYDLCVWTLRYSKPNRELKSGKVPIAAKVFNINDINNENILFDHIIKAFIFCVCLKYPYKKIEILSRYITVYSAIINIYETAELGDEIFFPYIGKGNEKIAQKIYKTVIDNFGRKIEMIFAVAKEIRVHSVRCLLENIFLLSVDNIKGKLCMNKIVKFFERKSWLKCRTGTNNIIEPTYDTIETYPLYEKNIKNVKFYEILDQSYISILSDLSLSYIKARYILEVSKIFFKDEKIIKQDIYQSNESDNLNNATNFEEIFVDSKILKRYIDETKDLFDLYKIISSLPAFNDNCKELLDFLKLIFYQT